MIDIDAILAQGAKAGIDLPREAAAMAVEMVAGLEGAWPQAAPDPQDRAPAQELLGAIATLVNRQDQESGPLAGRRLAVKDNIAVAHVATRIGTGTSGFTGEKDAAIVARSLAAGARIIAKAQCEALLVGANSFTSKPAPVRNPYDVRRSAGGSSSGSAALLAAGLCDIAFGTDSGGSVRIPAAYCGVVGFKPSRGAVPMTGIAPIAPLTHFAGPMARTVEDVTTLFHQIAGPDGVDPTASQRAIRAPGEGPSTLRQVRLGVFDDALKCCNAAPGDVLGAAINRLAAAGAQITRFSWQSFQDLQAPFLATYLISDAFASIGADGLAAATAPPGWLAWRQSLGTDQVPFLVHLSHATGFALHQADPGLLSRALERIAVLAGDLDARLAELDALVLPVVTTAAPLIPDGEPDPDQVFGDTALTAPFNATGHPALSLPAGMAGGMPVGLQLVAQRGADARLLQTARLIERALGRLDPPLGDHRLP